MIIIRKIEYGNLKHQVREYRTSLQEIRDLTTEIVSLGAATNKAAHWLGQMVEENKLRLALVTSGSQIP
jgi:hypothetical protein